MGLRNGAKYPEIHEAIGAARRAPISDEGTGPNKSMTRNCMPALIRMGSFPTLIAAARVRQMFMVGARRPPSSTPPESAVLGQVIGSFLLTDDISKEDILLVGRDGLLLAGPNIEAFEPCAPPPHPTHTHTCLWDAAARTGGRAVTVCD